MKRIGFVFCLILAFVMLSSIPVRSQTANIPVVKPVPQLTEVETLKIQNFVLKYQQLQTTIDQLQQQQAALRTSYQAVLSAIEAAHPGYTVNPNGNGDATLIEKPKAPEPAKTAAPEPKK
jgi:hypothetical protein